MRGKVLTFNGSTGLISGDDGKRYSFAASDLMGETAYVPKGSTVDFEPDGSTAGSVYLLYAGSGEKNRLVTALLAFFFGWLGLHKFYLGRTNAGIIMLGASAVSFFLHWWPMFAVWLFAFIETIIYLVKTDQSFYEDYVAGNKSWF